jgi:hypothetical protein
LILRKPKYFQKRKKKRQKRKRKSFSLPVVAKMQGCSGKLFKKLLEIQSKMDKKPEHSHWPCSFTERWTGGETG